MAHRASPAGSPRGAPFALPRCSRGRALTLRTRGAEPRGRLRPAWGGAGRRGVTEARLRRDPWARGLETRADLRVASGSGAAPAALPPGARVAPGLVRGGAPGPGPPPRCSRPARLSRRGSAVRTLPRPGGGRSATGLKGGNPEASAAPRSEEETTPAAEPRGRASPQPLIPLFPPAAAAWSSRGRGGCVPAPRAEWEPLRAPPGALDTRRGRPRLPPPHAAGRLLRGPCADPAVSGGRGSPGLGKHLRVL